MVDIFHFLKIQQAKMDSAWTWIRKYAQNIWALLREFRATLSFRSLDAFGPQTFGSSNSTITGGVHCAGHRGEACFFGYSTLSVKACRLLRSADTFGRLTFGSSNSTISLLGLHFSGHPESRSFRYVILFEKACRLLARADSFEVGSGGGGTIGWWDRTGAVHSILGYLRVVGLGVFEVFACFWSLESAAFDCFPSASSISFWRR